jgi:hypothetical protein
MCFKYVERLICKHGFEEYENDKDIRRSFKSIYTDLIKSKMLMNNIQFKREHDVHYMNLPKCIKKGNLYKLIDEVSEWREREEEGCPWSDLDETESELMARFQPPADYEQTKYDYSVDFSKITPEEYLKRTATGSSKNKRTMIEQAADVSAPVKMVKKMVKDKMKGVGESEK